MRPLKGIIACSLSTLCLAGIASAANLTWDIAPETVTGDGTITGGSGVWDLGTLNWTTDGGATNVGWANLAADTAIFGGTPGTVTISGGVTAGKITFESAGYTLTGGALTLSSTLITANANATIQNVLGGTGGFTKMGTGVLTLAGTASNTFTGAVTVAGGELVLNTAGVALTGDVTVNNGATLTLLADHQLADGGVVTVNGTLNTSGRVDLIAGLAGTGAVRI